MQRLNACVYAVGQLMPKHGMVPTHHVKKSTTSTTGVKNAIYFGVQKSFAVVVNKYNRMNWYCRLPIHVDAISQCLLDLAC